MLFQQILNGLTNGSLYALMAVGVTMVYKSLGMLNFAHGDIMMVGTFITLTFITKLGLPFYVSVPLGIICAAGLGFLLERVILRKVKFSSFVNLLIATVGVSYVLRNASMVIWGTNPQLFPSMFPSELIESELFGHEKGAFTSAIKQRKGKFEQADGGTLFMDEIGDMSLAAQAKVLRALQENKICRVGSDKDIDVDVRVIAATNKNLRDEITKGNFREDLYHRIGVIVVRVPALRDHAQDVPLLADHFIRTICAEYGIPPEIAREAYRRLDAPLQTLADDFFLRVMKPKYRR